MSNIPLKGPAFDNFINSLKTDKTKGEYSRLLVDFVKWRKVKTIDQLLIGDALELKGYITKYLTFLHKEKRLAPGTINIALASIRHFYTQNDVTLNWEIIRKFMPEDDVKREDRPYTYDEISKVLSIADMKYKAMIYLMVSSAIRIGALSPMQYGDLQKMPHHNIYKIAVYARTKSEYYTFASTEFFNAINAYIDFRKRSGEIITAKSPLWREDFDPNDKAQVKDARPITHDTIKSKLRSLLIRSGIAEYLPLDNKNTSGRRRNETMASHAFRKFAYTAMGKSRMDPESRELLCGHKIGVRGTYLKYSPEDLLNEYMRAHDALTINAENRLLAKVDEYKKQELEIQTLKQQLQSMSEAGQQAQESMINVKKQVDEMRQMIYQNVEKSYGKKELDKLVKDVGKDLAIRIKKKK
jgi:integrase